MAHRHNMGKYFPKMRRNRDKKESDVHFKRTIHYDVAKSLLCRTDSILFK